MPLGVEAMPWPVECPKTLSYPNAAGGRGSFLPPMSGSPRWPPCLSCPNMKMHLLGGPVQQI